jgi:8-oxo-dGTP pyrophosphatase MutT (NUDIX family)
MFDVHFFKKACRVTVTPEKKTYPEDLEKKVSEIWQLQKATKSPHLYDGQALSVLRYEGDEIFVAPTRYRYVLAQWNEPSLHSSLGISPVAVTGYTLWKGSVAIGKRASSLTYFPSHWELIPAGSLEASPNAASVDTSEAILKELEEELAVPRAAVREVSPVLLLHYKERHIYDIVHRIVLESNFLAVQKPPNWEYTELRWISVKDLAKFREEEKQILPSSKQLLLTPELWG